MRLCWTLSHLTELTQSNTKRSVDSSTMHQTPNAVLILQPCTHTHSVRCPRAYTMQCVIAFISCHIYNECYMDNTIYTTYRASWTITSPAYDFHTSFHSCQYIMHTYININIQHVILCSSNDTHTNAQSSHVMTICTYKLITCQCIRTHILTPKHITLSQATTLSNKSYNVPEASHKQSQTGPRDRSQTSHEHMPHAVIGLPRCSLPSPMRATPSPRQATPSPRRTRKPTNFILGFA